jgi:hypothetical protein
VGALGSSYMHVRNDAGVYPAGGRVGFVVESSEVVQLLEMVSALKLTTTLGGQEQESIGGADLLTLDVQGDDSGRALIGIETSEDYDGVQLDLGAPLGVLGTVDVYAVCAEVP